MNKGLSIALLVVGVVLIIFGFNAYDSVGSEISETVTGTPTNQSIWLFVLGLIALITGGVSLVLKRN